MGVGITSDGRYFRQDRAPRSSIKYPYRAVILGEEHIVKGWSGENLFTDRGQFVFRPFAKNGRSNWPPECRLLEVATVQPAGMGEWLLNGHRLSVLQFRSSGKRLLGVTQDEDLRIYKQEIRAVAWYLAVSGGSQTAELDIVLDDWRRAEAKEAIKPDAGQILSRLNSLFFMGWSPPIWLTGLESVPAQPVNVQGENIKPSKVKTQIHPPKTIARFENDFTIAVIPRKNGKVSRLTVEEELRKLVKEIVQAGGNKPRTELRRGKSPSWQPDKLLTSKTATELMKVRLLGKEKNGRTVIYSACESAS